MRCDGWEVAQPKDYGTQLRKTVGLTVLNVNFISNLQQSMWKIWLTNQEVFSDCKSHHGNKKKNKLKDLSHSRRCSDKICYDGWWTVTPFDCKSDYRGGQWLLRGCLAFTVIMINRERNSTLWRTWNLWRTELVPGMREKHIKKRFRIK